MKKLIAIALFAIMPGAYAGDAAYQACGTNKELHVTVCSDKGTKTDAQKMVKYLNAQMVINDLDDTVQFFVRKYSDKDRGPLSALFPQPQEDEDKIPAPSAQHL